MELSLLLTMKMKPLLRKQLVKVETLCLMIKQEEEEETLNLMQG